jgi:large subunit ribosomal protein L35
MGADAGSAAACHEEKLRRSMPKMKTHKGAQKRFRVTKNGKLMRKKQGGNHLRRKKRKVSDYRHKITSTNGSQIKLIKSLIN